MYLYGIIIASSQLEVSIMLSFLSDLHLFAVRVYSLVPSRFQRISWSLIRKLDEFVQYRFWLKDLAELD